MTQPTVVSAPGASDCQVSVTDPDTMLLLELGCQHQLLMMVSYRLQCTDSCHGVWRIAAPAEHRSDLGLATMLHQLWSVNGLI